MASMTIRNLDDELKARLRVRAAEHGRSMEEEARNILRVSLAEQPARASNLADSIRETMSRFGGGIDLDLPPREPIREPPDFK